MIFFFNILFNVIKMASKTLFFSVVLKAVSLRFTKSSFCMILKKHLKKQQKKNLFLLHHNRSFEGQSFLL